MTNELNRPIDVGDQTLLHLNITRYRIKCPSPANESSITLGDDLIDAYW